jgi:hypothetical protein
MIAPPLALEEAGWTGNVHPPSPLIPVQAPVWQPWGLPGAANLDNRPTHTTIINLIISAESSQSGCRYDDSAELIN